MFNSSSSYGGIGPGYKNPFEGTSPSWKQDYDWGGSSKGINWDSGFGIDKEGLFEKLFDKSRSTDKYRSWGERGYRDRNERPGVSWGVNNSGGSFQTGPDLWGVNPQQHSPLVIEGQRGRGGLFGQAGGLAGTLGTAFGIFGPLGPAIGAGLGGLVDTAVG